jgi:phosphatidylethanolamine-binding protein (PEBP) family uncharacterized protein
VASPEARSAGGDPARGSRPGQELDRERRQVHHYIFTVYTLAKQITLPPGASADELRAAIKGNVLAQGTLTGTYQRGAGGQ